MARGFKITSFLWSWLLATSVIAKKPNILFILTDDQDWHMQSLQHMPLLQKYVINEGTVYNNHFCTVAICCPSRVNLWTGRTAHNTNVTDLWPPYGGYPKVVQEGINHNYLPVWMQQAGYNTYYAGKLWNAHTKDNYNDPYVGGFNGSDFIIDPNTYEYYNALMTRNGDAPVSYNGQYSPDVVAQKAYDFLEEAMLHDDPFFLVAAPIAPHADINLRADPVISDAPKYAKRHAHLFKDYKIPRTENFNPENQSGVGWIGKLEMLNDTVIEYNDEFQRSRLRALQSVDEMIENLVKLLEKKGVLDNTYIFYTTDNGYHISQHRMHPGKECGFDTDIHIPLIVRGPGVAAGRTLDVVTAHTDLSPTILELAGGHKDDFDGSPIPLFTDSGIPDRSEHVNIEFWGYGFPEGIYGYYGSAYDGDGYNGKHLYRNNTYKSVRIVAKDYSLYYSVWCSNEREFYNVQDDPGQLRNLFDNEVAASKFELAGQSFSQVVARLDALMMVLKSCKREDCRDPWKVLHPQEDVKDLKAALSKTFDVFYHEQPKVSFSRCEVGYILASEGPQNANIFGAMDGVGKATLEENRHGAKDEASYGQQKTFKYGGHWSLWT